MNKKIPIALTVMLAAVALSACESDTEKLASCSGPIFALNTDRWHPTPAELQKPADDKEPKE